MATGERDPGRKITISVIRRDRDTCVLGDTEMAFTALLLVRLRTRCAWGF